MKIKLYLYKHYFYQKSSLQYLSPIKQDQHIFQFLYFLFHSPNEVHWLPLSTGDFSGTTITFHKQRSRGSAEKIEGLVHWVLNKQDAGTAKIGGYVFENDRFLFGMNWGQLFFILQGVLIDDDQLIGRLDGIFGSDMTGFYSISQVPLGDAWIYMGLAMAGLLTVARTGKAK